MGDPGKTSRDEPAQRAPASSERGERQGRGGAMANVTALRQSAHMSAGYSRFVQGLRLVLPFCTVVIVLVVALWPEFNEIENTITSNEIAIRPEDAERLTMSNPRYMSRDENGMAYTVTADLAEQLDAENTHMNLTNPAADVTMEDGSWLMLQADMGEYWDEERLLDLFGSVSLFHDAGYEFHTEQAAIDFVAGRAEGHEPVDGFGPFGDIQSEGFVIEDRGAVIIFTGRAHMVLRVDQDMPSQ